MIAGGSGIAPMIPIIKSILENEKDETLIHLLYSNRTKEDILLKKEIDSFAGYWNFSRQYILTRIPSDTDFGYHKKIFVAGKRIDLELIKSQLQNLTQLKILVCGSKDFNQTIVNILQDLNISQELIYVFE